MAISDEVREIFSHLERTDHSKNNYFQVINQLVQRRNNEGEPWQEHIDAVYAMVLDEIATNDAVPQTAVKFGTSGWRGLLGKDIFVRSISFVTAAIVELYAAVDRERALIPFLGVQSFEEARKRGCVVGFDNRFGGEILASAVIDVLVRAGFAVHYAGESTTGVLSAAVLELGAAFSVNLTPSHNPLEYGGYKFNAADAGPAASELTSRITAQARRIIEDGVSHLVSLGNPPQLASRRKDIFPFNSLAAWKNMVRKNVALHGLQYDQIMKRFEDNP